MREVFITDWQKANIPGVRFASVEQQNTYCEDYFTCTPMPLKTRIHSDEVVCGILHGWHHTPVFRIWETHADAETFYYFHGTALMPFCDLKDGKPDLSTAVIVRIPAGVQVEVAAGKAHFVAVAEDDKFSCLCYCPDQSADRVLAEEPLVGVYAQEGGE